MSAGAAGGGAGTVVRQGHLRKLKTMKKKYFVLRAESSDCSARLEYYESEKKFRAGAAPRRVLPLKSCYNITRRLDLKQKHVIALFTKEEQFCIVAENEPDLHAWLTAILKQHRSGSDDASEELLHPIQHVWQVNVQKKGLGSSKNIQGLYNLCLTDKTLALVKIKSHNNVISDLGIPERIEYSLKNIRRCGDSECFFYMEVGRQTSTGAGELWMHSDDSNIAQSMHSTIYLAMRNCAKETENERDHIILPKGMEGSAGPLPPRRQTYSDARGRAGLTNDKGLCVGSCIRQCVCSSATYSIDDSAAAIAPLTPKHAENQPPNNSLSIDNPEKAGRVIKHHRTVSLPTGCPSQEPPRVAHERTRSAPLTGEEVDAAHKQPAKANGQPAKANGQPTKANGQPAKANGEPPKKAQWARRASTGARLSKLSPAHSKNAGPLRSRCDSMPSRACSSYEVERPAPRHTELEGLEMSRDETDAVVEWYRTPRIPEEPDICDVTRDFISSGGRVGGPISGGSIQHSRTSSMGTEDVAPDGYLHMAPGHEPLPALVSASSGSVCSGTPSTDPRFSEYQLEPATSHIVEGCRPPRAWSVGSRAAVGAGSGAGGGGGGGAGAGADGRLRAYSVGAGGRPPASAPRAPASAPLLPRASAADLMELDFSANCSPQPKVILARTPPSVGFAEPRPRNVIDEYVDMSPRNAGFVTSSPAPTVDGYVEMNYTRAPTRPIAIVPRPPAPAAAPVAAPAPAPAAAAAPSPAPASSPPRRLAARTPLGSQTIFPLSLDSPASPPEIDAAEVFDEDIREEPLSHPLTTVREISEEGLRRSPSGDASCSPQYVRLAGARPAAVAGPGAGPGPGAGAATVVVAAGRAGPARFSVGSPPASPPPTPTPSTGAGAGVLHYAALDLQPRRASQPPPARTYTQIDFLRSEKLHADAT